jgi:ABC-type phosphate transport system auxiliary subunit
MMTDCITQADTGLTALDDSSTAELLERLARRRELTSIDGCRWYMSSAADRDCQEAAAQIERLRAERDTEEACARLHAGLLREVALALGDDLGDDRRTLPERVRELRSKLDRAPVALMDTRVALGLCAMTEADFPALHALQGRRVALVDLGPNDVAERPGTQ